jgi:predicted enzyme related to lactoylglutathione lyase
MPTESQAQQKKESMNHGGNPAVWVEIPVKDIERAKKFYSAVFGYQFQMHDTGDGYTLAMFNAAPDRYGSGGALIKGETYKPSHDGTVVYLSTQNIDESLKKIGAAGGKTVLPKKSIGEYGFIAHFEDTEGNRVALHTMNG